ncbi:T9SS type A sorting domain-containing protein [uncultured Spirosoma sp.]|uniref:T9SS type A sorting domain-containing protein n=1 Tax=uncultured Spirosoma sp. TaxID=278208 RepID=UPI00262F405A|nr:T9SS type A sorting domain-containing protein [uncultured Spirosoma sp.]
MVKKLLLFLVIGLCGVYTAYAQDPLASGVTLTAPTAYTIGQTISATVSFGNGSSVPISQSSAAAFTVTVPPQLGVTGSATVTAGVGTTANLSASISSYNSTTGTTITIRSDLGDIPSNALYNLFFTLRAISITDPLAANPQVRAVATSNLLDQDNGGPNNTANDNNARTGFAVSAGSVQPVSLVSFTAKPQEDQTIALAWTTSWETNNKGFLIERSKDLKTFQTVGEVTEIGASSESLKNYRLTDFTPFRGTSYYRLTQLDLDGKSTILKVESVVLRDGAYGVFPNPVVSNQPFRVSLDEPTTAQLNFYSSDGHVVSLQQSGVQGDTVLLKADSKLSTGVYVLTVEERGQIRKHRIVIE